MLTQQAQQNPRLLQSNLQKITVGRNPARKPHHRLDGASNPDRKSHGISTYQPPSTGFHVTPDFFHQRNPFDQRGFYFSPDKDGLL